MKTEDDIKHLKIIWAFMLEHGQVTNGKWSYYGGWEVPDNCNRWDYTKADEVTKELQKNVLKFGVDWQETDTPEYVCESEFCGTDSPSSEHECFLGRIVTNNREAYIVGTREVESAAKFAHEALTVGIATQNLVDKWFGV